MSQSVVRLPARRWGVLRNGIYGAAEYIAQPLGIVVAAPYLMRHLGTAQFGVWVLATAAVNSGNLISSGSGDATVRYVAMYRGRKDAVGAEQAVRATLAINLVLSAVAAAAIWLLAPSIASHSVHGIEWLRAACTESLRIGSLLLVVRSVDSVLGCTLRAFERYGPAAWLATMFRLGVLAAAVGMARTGRGVVSIMAATLALAALSVIAQGVTLYAIAGRIVLLPSLAIKPLLQIMGFGTFSWLQGTCSVAFGQADRVIVGIILGAPAVALYGLCAQVAQSIHGTTAAGLHVLFPHVSRRLETEGVEEISQTVKATWKINVTLAAMAGSGLALFSRPLLTGWMGQEFAMKASHVFATLSIAFALFAMNVTAHYTLLALGRIRLVVAANLAAGFAMLMLMVPLAERFGIEGAACARLVAGPITCLLYLPLVKQMRAVSRRKLAAASVAAWENA